ncbi:hypothetical protein CKK33_00480 [Mucilaginibacter sp. MD40]|uniref:tetratricopeptide repeat protein n=1 Tax=Mucilaginibacter sp. MD40 TaxID=2029590 RepID=UPI000BAC5FB6|nr:tetratricopeptide repeat protein [Mucilaginibacter sp. MD40]PAW92048.1 hypothetical protein CKK33_00480 [Mucilaginibacter sp. MD40]
MNKNLIAIVSIIALVIVGWVFYNILFNKSNSTDISAIKDQVQSGQYDFDEGKRLMDSEKYAEAEKHFLAVLQHKDNLGKESYINTLVNLGVCCAQQQKLADAEKYWKEAADLGDETAKNNLALLHKAG